MVPYGTFWYLMVPYGTLRYLMVPYGTLWLPYGTSRRLRGIKTRIMVETGTGEFCAVASPLGGTMKPVLNI